MSSDENTTTRFDHARLAVTAGDGIVGRFPGITCVARPADHAAVPELLEHCAKAAGPNPGRALARRLAGWLSGPDAPGDDLEFGTLSLAGEKVALFLLGDVSAHVDGRPVASGGSSAAWADHLMAFPDSPVLLAADSVPASPGLVGGVTDLRDGVVPGGGVAFVPVGVSPGAGVAPASAAAPAAAATPAVQAPPAQAPLPPTAVADLAAAQAPAAQAPAAQAPAAQAPAAQAPAAQAPAARAPAAPEAQSVAPSVTPAAPAEEVAPSPPRRSEALVGMPVDEREPLEAGLPVGARPAAPPPSRAGGGSASGATPGSAGSSAAPAGVAEPGGSDDGEAALPQTRGHLCSRGHLNDPRSHFCVLCGIRMNERTGVLVLGPRPPLGLLVLDNGATFTVDAEYLIGRTPETDQRVSGGELRPLTVEDTEGAVSRVHAEVRVRGWDVILVDSGSRNGTFVAPPGEQGWTPVASGKSHRLAPGTRVRLGERRTFLFESPSGVR